MQISLSVKTPVKEFRVLLDNAIKAQTKTVHALYAQRTNSTVAPDYYKALGRLEALEAVKKATEGTNIDLRILGE